MTNEQNHPSPSSRRPIIQVRETEGQDDPASSQNFILSSLSGSFLSRSWRPPTPSFSSYDSREYDTFSHIRAHDSEFLPSPTALFHHAMGPVAGSQPVNLHRSAAVDPYQPQHFPKTLISSQTHAAQFPDPHSAAPYAAQFSDIPESQGPHLPYPYLTQESQFAKRQSSRPTRRGRTQPRQSARSSRGTSQPYHGRRASHNLRLHPAPTQSFATFHPSSRAPFQTPQFYPITPSQVKYEPDSRRTVPPSSKLLVDPIPMSPLPSMPSGAISPHAVQPPVVGIPTQHTSHSMYDLGARPLPNVGELTDILSSQQLEYSPTDALSHALPQTRKRKPRKHKQLNPQLGHHMQKRRNAPHPFTSFAVMLADIISNSPRKKMTLQELYDYLQTHYPDHFPDSEESNKDGGWKVSPPSPLQYFTDVG